MPALARATLCDCDVPPGGRSPLDGSPQRGRIRFAVQALRPTRCHADHPLSLGTLAESVRAGGRRLAGPPALPAESDPHFQLVARRTRGILIERHSIPARVTDLRSHLDIEFIHEPEAHSHGA